MYRKVLKKICIFSLITFFSVSPLMMIFMPNFGINSSNQDPNLKISNNSFSGSFSLSGYSYEVVLLEYMNSGDFLYLSYDSTPMSTLDISLIIDGYSYGQIDHDYYGSYIFAEIYTSGMVSIEFYNTESTSTYVDYFLDTYTIYNPPASTMNFFMIIIIVISVIVGIIGVVGSTLLIRSIRRNMWTYKSNEKKTNLVSTERYAKNSRTPIQVSQTHSDISTQVPTFCYFCGKKVKAYAGFCPKCGAKL